MCMGAAGVRLALAEDPGLADGVVSLMGDWHGNTGLAAVFGERFSAFRRGQVDPRPWNSLGLTLDMGFFLDGPCQADQDRLCRELAAIRVPFVAITGLKDGWISDTVADPWFAVVAEVAPRFTRVDLPVGHLPMCAHDASLVGAALATAVLDQGLGIHTRIEPHDLLDPREQRRMMAAERDAIPAGTARKFHFDRVQTEQWWTSYLHGYEHIEHLPEYRGLVSDQIALLRPRSGRWLDAGCGTGNLSMAILDELARVHRRGALESAEITLLDVSDAAVQRCSKRLKMAIRAHELPRVQVQRTHFNLDTVGAPGGRLPHDDEYFDGAVASLLLSYVQDPLAVLRELWRCIKPGGVLVASTGKPDVDLSVTISGWSAGDEHASAQPHASQQIRAQLADFIGAASDLVKIESFGDFEFYTMDDFAAALASAGFVIEARLESFGGEGYVVCGRKPPV